MARTGASSDQECQQGERLTTGLEVRGEDLAVIDERGEDVVALNDALEALAQFDERRSRVVELRFFGSLTVTETAAVLEVSEETVARDWRFARSWLIREMKGT